MEAKKRQKRQKLTELEIKIILNELRWSELMGLKSWAKVFGDIGTRRMRSLFEAGGENGGITNQRMSPCLWRVPLFEIPHERTLKIICKAMHENDAESLRKDAALESYAATIERLNEEIRGLRLRLDEGKKEAI